MKNLYPMDFEEFLLAHKQTVLLDMIKEHFENFTAMPTAWHSKALEYYRLYTLVGGMPAVVEQLITNNHTTLEVTDLQEFIINSYIKDMSKYASKNDTMKIIACYESIPVQLAKDNKKFQYKIVQKGGSSSLFGDSLQWLISARCNFTMF